VRLGEQRYRVIFDSIYDGILVVQAETYEFFDANPRMCTMFGYSQRRDAECRRARDLALDRGDDLLHAQLPA
jgi:PAS domain S-box-containing protein